MSHKGVFVVFDCHVALELMASSTWVTLYGSRFESTFFNVFQPQYDFFKTNPNQLKYKGCVHSLFYWLEVGCAFFLYRRQWDEMTQGNQHKLATWNRFRPFRSVSSPTTANSYLFLCYMKFVWISTAETSYSACTLLQVQERLEINDNLFNFSIQCNLEYIMKMFRISR